MYFFSPYQLKYYFPNCNFSDQMRETSTRAGVWKGLCYLCKLRPQTTFLLHRGLALSCKDFIRVTFEINSFWYDAEILFENRYTFRFTPLLVHLLIKVWNGIVEKHALNRFKNVAAEPGQTAVPDNYSTWSSSPKHREVLIHCCICHINTYFQDALAYLEKDWYHTSYKRPLQLIITVGRRV